MSKHKHITRAAAPPSVRSPEIVNVKLWFLTREVNVHELSKAWVPRSCAVKGIGYACLAAMPQVALFACVASLGSPSELIVQAANCFHM